MSEDPIGLKSGDLNFYRYTNNGPILKNDPTGKYTFFFQAANFVISMLGSAEIYSRESDIIRFTSQIEANRKKIKELSNGDPCNSLKIQTLYEQNQMLYNMRRELRQEQKNQIVLSLATLGLSDMVNYAISYLTAF